MSYCTYVNNNPSEQADYLLHKHYHDNQYGFRIEDDDELFGRLLLEINQAGLSWTLMLRKQDSFRAAYDNFSIEKVAAYEESDRERLLANPGIVRNRLKVNAAIVNAQKILELKNEYGSFKGWIDAHHPLTKEQWVKLFKKTFKFTGGEIVNEFLMSTGYLPGAHDADCPVYQTILPASR
ncbi:DNA-3-methyladenine glycosylase I [Dyadobacter sp. SG02]|uniref:DNA-3-methyladenine glycosylase I n=1 Tax=Dyadobacter sp. SG02 TaxID=1855291 RepID=UPI0008B93305|nr:DNA-3-methyladenine glycosylase I [Dyadobacter sp. SG02]SEI89917.1 DNA-3-methyladenine glycosylase I [Dyadobacter sp. SG02]